MIRIKIRVIRHVYCWIGGLIYYPIQGSGGAKHDGDPLTIDDNVDLVTGELFDTELGRKSSACSSILYMYQATSLVARKIVVNYMLFRRLLLPIGEVNKLVARPWKCSFTGDIYIEFPNKANVYVCQNIIHVEVESWPVVAKKCSLPYKVISGISVPIFYR